MFYSDYSDLQQVTNNNFVAPNIPNYSTAYQPRR